MSFARIDPDGPLPEPNESAMPTASPASLPGDPFPWAPDPSLTEPPAAPADTPADSDPLFPPDLGEGD